MEAKGTRGAKSISERIQGEESLYLILKLIIWLQQSIPCALVEG